MHRSAAVLALALGATAALAQDPPTAAPPDAAAPPRVHAFQQGVDYVIEAVLDDASHVLRGRAELRYVNRSPDALDRVYFHQYLNAFRPNSAWAAYDLGLGRRTYQDLGRAAWGFERILDLRVDGRVARPVYPGAPDSTVFYVELAEPLPPGDSLTMRIDWTARLSTVARRQGRRGRLHNWAHWYPRIAVYGPGGWEYRAHVRQGEFNGAFASYDVTMELAADLVVGATGVPASGDPGWERAAVPLSDPPRYRRDYYGEDPAAPLGLLEGEAAPGRKRIRWRAEDVHHFAWAASPDFRYLGGRWDETAIHLLWEPSNQRWDAQRVMAQQKEALDWVRELFGEYPWPQITVADRVEQGGATEFPMLYMTAGGAVVHETMHMIAHGALANNEWREGWLDEGMASFLADWMRVRRGEDPGAVWGRTERMVARLDALGRSEPIALPGAEFNPGLYSLMTYDKASLVLRMLRDRLGEDVFRRGLRLYYERYRFRQVTGEDFKRVMEEVSGEDLDPFFRRWIETTEGRFGG